MPVPFLDLSRQNREIRDRALALFSDILEKSAFIGGHYVQEFETNFARFCQVPFGVAVNSGTEALRLAIPACGLEPGEEIVTVPFTFIATAEVVTQNNARLVFADIDPDTYNLDPRKLEAAITPRTRGIIPVHLYGNPAPMDAIMDIARRRNLWVIEDACQAHGATLGGRPAGGLGTVGTFSFYPTKNLGATGEGGFVTTHSEEIAQKVLALRNHGQSARYAHEFEGYNARLDALKAAVLNEKLQRLPEWNRQRAHWADAYYAGLRNVGDLVMPPLTEGATHAWHLFSVRTARRDALRAFLTERGIGTAVHYPIPLHVQKAYLHLGYAPDDFPVSMECSRTVLSLPLFQGITEAEVAETIAAVKAFFDRS
jgi:dTDP-4-amino-4,6-dideoxygalactose transaminase